MSEKVREIEDTLYFWFAANDTYGSAGDGASAAADVRLAGAAADAAPVLSPTPTLLSSASYPDGCYEVAVEATTANGFAAGNDYAVFCTLAIDSQNPAGIIGEFRLTAADDAPNTVAAIQSGLSTHSAADVWTSGSRTLSSFGTLVADIATAVWGAAARTLTAFGFTPNANVTQVGGTVVSGPTDLKADVSTLATSAEIATLNDLSEAQVQAIADAIETHGDTTWSTADLTGVSTLTEAQVQAIVNALNDLSSADTQAAVTAALNAYDPPTKAELDLAWQSSSGSGSCTVPFTFSDGAGTLANGLTVHVEDAAGNVVAGPLVTSSLGIVTFMLDADADTYTVVSASTSAWQGNSEAVTITALSEDGVDVTLTATSIPAPVAAGYCTVHGSVRSVGGTVGAGTVYVTEVHSPRYSGTGTSKESIFASDDDGNYIDSATIDANGQWSISILQGAVVDIWISLTNGKDLSASHRLIPNTDTANYEDLEYQS